MTTVYEILRVSKKGAAYKTEQIKEHSWLHQNNSPDVDKPVGALAGRSRIFGDVDEKTQDRIIDILIELGSRYKLSYRDTAHMLLLCRVESGFNPDAAAGTTSAAGLGQYTKGTVKEAAKDSISKRLLGFNLDMHGKGVFDAERGAYGVLLSFLICREKSIGFYKKDYEQYLYLFHHEGWNFQPTPEKLTSDRIVDVLNIINKKILPKLDDLEKALSQKTELSFKLLTKDDKPHADQPYLAVYTNEKKSDVPTHVQNTDLKKKVTDFFLGSTDGEGKTQPLSIAAMSEVIFVVLNKQYRDLLNIDSNSDTYKVKKGDSLSKIAKENGTTVEELKNANSLKGDQIQIGQTLKLHTGNYLWRRPPMELISEYLKIALPTMKSEAVPAIVEHKRSHIALPKGNQAQQHKNEKNVVAIKSGTTHEELQQRKKVEEVPHKTVEKNITKEVKVEKTSGTPLKEGLLFPLEIPATDDYHTGARRFGTDRPNGRKHAGCDLYAPVGTAVRAMADGVIIQCYDFYCNTDAIEVDHGDFIVRYGELEPREDEDRKLLAGKPVKRGEKLGEVGVLIMNKKPYKYSMLHLEMYGSNRSPKLKGNGLTNKESNPYQRRDDLVDPTDTLDKSIFN
jgi:murein DD-endopeptidase MepM/ murein hydrolase activator NlpD